MTQGAILVTGAGGFVCSEIALALHRRDHEVVAVDQTFDAPTARRLAGIRCVEGPVPGVLDDAGPGRIAAVIHGAAITASPEALGISAAEHLRRNTDMLTGTLAYARRAGVARFLNLSSMGVFAPGDGPARDGRFTEETQPTATCAYCAAKQAGELLTAAAAEPGFDTLSVRLGNIFGPHEAVRVTRQQLCLVSRMRAEAEATGVISVPTPDAVREWAWLPDLAAGIAALINVWAGASTPLLHAGTPPAISDLDLARAIAARSPGTHVHPAAPPHDAVRPPMGSAVAGCFDAHPWTDMDAALDVLMPLGATS